MAESTGGLNINEETFEEALAEIKRLGALATIHAEDEKMRLELEELLKGDISLDYHSKVRPNACEAAAVQKALELISRTESKGAFLPYKHS